MWEALHGVIILANFLAGCYLRIGTELGKNKYSGHKADDSFFWTFIKIIFYLNTLRMN